MDITVTLIHSGARWPRKRRQPWRWVAKAANGKTVATSGENYTNRDDAIAAIYGLFGDQVKLVIRGQ